ncbi:MAG: hypothetical protein M1819_004289 [Sarea resinae]|nr:MAG: hypothetical protein M1819_004289 [Sarea resinae]
MAKTRSPPTCTLRLLSNSVPFVYGASISICPQRIHHHHYPQRRRHASTLARLHHELTSRRLPLVYDYLTPQASHLLNLTLADFLPQFPANSHPTPPTSATLPQTSRPRLLPPSHHLIYFPPAVPSSLLLPDGTDPLQSPGPPFNRRMWAGGSVHFHPLSRIQSQLLLDGARAVCVEGIRDVRVKGIEGSEDEKVFVDIERRVGRCLSDAEDEASIRARLWPETAELLGREEASGTGEEAAVVERREIVFMRDRSVEAAREAAGKAGRVVRGK